MNTATALVVDKSSNAYPEQDMTPYLIRWGFQAAVRDRIMSAYECGITYVPFAKFFPIKSFIAPRENHTTDDTKERETLTTIPASEVEAYLMQALGGTGIQDNVNWGLTTAFRGDEDTSKMAVISEVLVPDLPTIRVICASLGQRVIEPVCPATDDLDYGSRNSCVTCNFQWLTSDAIKAYIEQIAFQGMPVTERDPVTGVSTDRVIKPTLEELKTAHAVALAAARQGKKQLETQWAQISAEYDSSERIRKDITEFEHGYRKDLHQNKPQDRQFALARELAKGNSGSNDAVIEMLAQSQAQTNQLLGRMVERLEAPPVPVTVTSPVITTGPAEPTTVTTDGTKKPKGDK